MNQLLVAAGADAKHPSTSLLAEETEGSSVAEFKMKVISEET